MLQHSPGSRVVIDEMDVDNPEAEGSSEDRLASEQASKLKALAGKVEDFVAGQGDLEGAQFEECVFCCHPRPFSEFGCLKRGVFR